MSKARYAIRLPGGEIAAAYTGKRDALRLVEMHKNLTSAPHAHAVRRVLFWWIKVR